MILSASTNQRRNLVTFAFQEIFSVRRYGARQDVNVNNVINCSSHLTAFRSSTALYHSLQIQTCRLKRFSIFNLCIQNILLSLSASMERCYDTYGVYMDSISRALRISRCDMQPWPPLPPVLRGEGK